MNADSRRKGLFDQELRSVWQEGLSAEQYGKAMQELEALDKVQPPELLKSRLELIPKRSKISGRERRFAAGNVLRPALAAGALLVVIGVYMLNPQVFRRQAPGSGWVASGADAFLALIVEDSMVFDDIFDEDVLALGEII